MLRVRGRAATVERLLAFVPGARPSNIAGDLRILGHERATDSAIVAFDWAPPPRSPSARREFVRPAVVRVPLDGRRPSALHPGTTGAG